MPEAVLCAIGIITILGAAIVLGALICSTIHHNFGQNRGWSCGRFMKIINRMKDLHND